MNTEKNYLGIGKTKFNSNVCLIPNGDLNQLQIWQSERINRKKNSGVWPLRALEEMDLYKNQNKLKKLKISENRDVETVIFFEDFYDQQFPFYENLLKKNMGMYSCKFNREISFVTHHEAHAYAALMMSPFNKAIIIIMDGAGNRAKDFEQKYEGIEDDNELEECSVYLQNDSALSLIKKRWIKFEKNHLHTNHLTSNGIGYFYEKVSEYIFNNSSSAGKVMGLAAFGNPLPIKDRIDFQNNIDWKKRFIGKNKKEWEEELPRSSWPELASSVQQELELDYLLLINSLKEEYPEYENIILTGGCALNCTNNAKILHSKLFKKMYVPPYPGDESIGLGLASKMLFEENAKNWKPMKIEYQSAYRGPYSSIPNEVELIQMLKKRNLKYQLQADVVLSAMKELVGGKIIGWFQGRSESGPRALGNRSILVRPDRKGIKEHLNARIKHREYFRPYGCSVTHEMASEYFVVDRGFDNPFMSYALEVREKYTEILKEVSHIDGTSRMQTVRSNQNKLFYDLITHFGKETGLYCLLNTSLNVMGEPIVETMEDALSFFEKTQVDCMYIGKIKIFRN